MLGLSRRKCRIASWPNPFRCWTVFGFIWRRCIACSARCGYFFGFLSLSLSLRDYAYQVCLSWIAPWKRGTDVQSPPRCLLRETYWSRRGGAARLDHLCRLSSHQTREGWNTAHSTLTHSFEQLNVCIIEDNNGRDFPVSLSLGRAALKNSFSFEMLHATL